MRRHARVAAPRADDVLVSASVGAHGELVTLWTDEGAADALRGRAGGIPSSNSDLESHVTARVVIRRPDGAEHAMVLRDLSVAHPRVQPLPDGGLLVVGSRCRYRPEGPEHNAIVFDAMGDSVNSGTLGDGIQEVQVTPSGQIWVSYYDEGINGNLGRGRGEDGQPTTAPVGSRGLVAFGPDLEPKWIFPGDGSVPPIHSCYALNVSGETAWAYYYDEFPIVRIESGTTTSWTGAPTSSRALITDGTTCALLGGGIVTGRLNRGFEDANRAMLLVDGGFLPKPKNTITATGRGTGLHLVTDTADWYRLDLDDLT